MTQTPKSTQNKKPRWKTRTAVNIKGESIEKSKERKERQKKKRRSFLPHDVGFRAAKAVDLPIDIIAGVPHFEFSGNREVVVEGCRGIIGYDENMTTLDLGKMKVRFMGRCIELRNFTDHSIIVDGFITSVEFLT